MNIVKTRSRDTDTDYATLGIVIYAADGTQLNTYGPTTIPIGDVANGEHGLGILSTGIDVPEGATMGVSFTIANRGSSAAVNAFVSGLNDVCEGLLGALASGQIAGYATSAQPASPPGATTVTPEMPSQAKAINVWWSILAEIGTLTVVGLVDYFLADCDGMVVTDALTIGRTELDQLATQGWWSFDRTYPGDNSPDGCGANSNYTVTYQVLASPPGVTVPQLVGVSGSGTTVVEQVGHILEPTGLLGLEAASVKANVDLPVVAEQNPSAGWVDVPGSYVYYTVRVPEGGDHPPP